MSCTHKLHGYPMGCLPYFLQLYVPADVVGVGSGVDVMWVGDGDFDGVGDVDDGMCDSIGESSPLLHLCSAV